MVKENGKNLKKREDEIYTDEYRTTSEDTSK